MDKEKLSKKLRNLREIKDLNRKEVAAKLNISYDAYSRKERGERRFHHEELEKLAAILGKNINDFFNEQQIHPNHNKKNSEETTKTEIDLLESIICMISAEIEIKLFRKYDLNYLKEEIYPTFDEYIKSADDNLGYSNESPQAVFNEIKRITKEYGEFIVNPHGWYRKKYKERYPFFKDNKFFEEKSKDFGEYHPFHPYFTRKDYEYFKDKEDAWLREFVIQEENYYTIYTFILDGSVMVNPKSPEEAYTAFQNMMEEEPVIQKLFQYGLLEKSWFDEHWKKWAQENNIDSKLAVGEQIRKKMNDIFERKNKQDFYLKNNESWQITPSNKLLKNGVLSKPLNDYFEQSEGSDD